MASVRLTMRSELTWSVSSAMRPGDGRRFDPSTKMERDGRSNRCPMFSDINVLP